MIKLTGKTEVPLIITFNDKFPIEDISDHS